MVSEQPRLELAYQVFEAMIEKRAGSLPEGVRRYLRDAYFSGAAGMISTSKLITMFPQEEQQAALDNIAKEISEALR